MSEASEAENLLNDNVDPVPRTARLIYTALIYGISDRGERIRMATRLRGLLLLARGLEGESTNDLFEDNKCALARAITKERRTKLVVDMRTRLYSQRSEGVRQRKVEMDDDNTRALERLRRAGAVK